MEWVLKSIIARRSGITFCASRTVEYNGLELIECRYFEHGEPYSAKAYATAAWISSNIFALPDSFDDVSLVASIERLENGAAMYNKPWPKQSEVEECVKTFNNFGLQYCKKQYPGLSNYIHSVKGFFVPTPMLALTLVDKEEKPPKFLGTIKVVPPKEITVLLRADSKIDYILSDHEGVSYRELRFGENIKLLENN